MAEYQKPGDRLKEITDQLEKGLQDLFSSGQYTDYLKTMSKFYDYSASNSLLIFMQRPDASHVAGYGAWQKNFNRHVKRGEHGIKILAPTPFKQMVEMEKIDPVTQRAMTGADGKPVTEVMEVTRAAFKPVTVFDVSQTEGEPLPQLGVNELTGDVENYPEFFEALKQTAPFPIGFEAITSGAKGYCNYQEQRIAIKEGMAEIQNVKTAIHEITHATLHNYYAEKEKNVLPENRKDQRTREVEAESVAYTVCQHYGIDTADYSFGYIAGWSSGRETKELKASLATIRETAAGLITSIDEKYRELIKEQEQQKAAPAVEAPEQAEPPVPTLTALEQQAVEIAKRYEKLGANIEEVKLPSLKHALSAYYVISSAEASSNLARFDGIRYGYRSENAETLDDIYKNSRSEGFGPEVQRRIMLGTFALSSGYYDAYYKKALQVRTLVVRDYNKVFEKCDFIISPVAPTTAYKLGEKTDNPLEMYMGDIYSVPINIAGVPSLSLPCGKDGDNMPIGMQLIGKPLGEATLYRAGYAFETDYAGGANE